MEVSRAIDLIDDKMCWGRGTFSVHHMPEYDEYWQAGEMAIDALKKQEQKKPIEEHRNAGFEYWVNVCPTCGEVLSDCPKYCPECGQSLCWEEEEE